jgi:hypothetical protein
MGRVRRWIPRITDIPMELRTVLFGKSLAELNLSAALCAQAVGASCRQRKSDSAIRLSCRRCLHRGRSVSLDFKYPGHSRLLMDACY